MPSRGLLGILAANNRRLINRPQPLWPSEDVVSILQKSHRYRDDQGLLRHATFCGRNTHRDSGLSSSVGSEHGPLPAKEDRQGQRLGAATLFGTLAKAAVLAARWNAAAPARLID